MKQYWINIPDVKKKRCRPKEETKRLLPSEFRKLEEKNYKVKDLKGICRDYKIKIGGNKDILMKRLYNYLRLTYNVLKIQTNYKKCMRIRLEHARGPAVNNIGICVNETDFFTMEPLIEIKKEQFISYKDIDNMIYGFDILSLSNLVKKSKKPYLNPYNRNQLPTRLIKNMEGLIKGNKKINIVMDVEDIDHNKNIELQILDLFQEINVLGNYCDHNWLYELDKKRIISFINNVIDIWNYRAQLPIEVKKRICPPYGTPFVAIINNPLNPKTINELRSICISIITKLVMTSNDNSDRNLGATYVLCGLTLVSEKAALELPWLYQSVANVN